MENRHLITSCLPRIGFMFGLLGTVASCTSYNQQRSYDEAAAARETPHFAECTGGKKLQALNNCAEVCQSLGQGCQNYGCDHPTEKARYGGLAYGGSLCLEGPQRAFQCTDAFDNDVGVRCCCVKQ